MGQSSWEEINDGIAGSNYGWPNAEGSSGNPAFRNPLYVYNHTTGNPTGCAITGGAFYAPGFRHFPAEYNNDYFFADYCNKWIWTYDSITNTATQFATGLPSNTVDLKVGPDGSLFYLERGTGGAGFVGRIRYTTGIYGLSDAAAAVRIASGLAAVDPVQATRLNVDDSGAPTGVIDLADAVCVARMVAG